MTCEHHHCIHFNPFWRLFSFGRFGNTLELFVMEIWEQKHNIIEVHHSLNANHYIVSQVVYYMSEGIFVLTQAPGACSEPHQNTCKMLMCILLQILAAFSSLQTSSGMFSARCSVLEQVQVTSALSLANGSGNPFRTRRGSFLKVKAFLQSNPLNKPPAWVTCPQAGMSQTSCPLAKI